MVLKRGQFGTFYACSGYPDCKTTRRIGEGERKADVPLDEKCPQCDSNLVLKYGRFGEFTACSNYPTCKYVKQKTIGVKCPECGEGEIIERRSKRGKTFYGCNRYPDCKFVAWSKPMAEKCPECGHPYLLEKWLKSGHFAQCPNEECKHRHELAPVEKRLRSERGRLYPEDGLIDRYAKELPLRLESVGSEVPPSAQTGGNRVAAERAFLLHQAPEVHISEFRAFRVAPARQTDGIQASLPVDAVVDFCAFVVGGRPGMQAKRVRRVPRHAVAAEGGRQPYGLDVDATRRRAGNVFGPGSVTTGTIPNSFHRMVLCRPRTRRRPESVSRTSTPQHARSCRVPIE